MAYNSRYFVQAHNEDSSLSEECMNILKLAFDLRAGTAGYKFLEGSYLYAGDLPWYSWKEDLTRFIGNWPGIKITVTRFGEDADDIERVCFESGTFVESKLKWEFE